MIRIIQVMLACMLSTACTFLPNATIAYYPPSATTYLSVSQTIACNGDGSAITTTTTPNQTILYKNYTMSDGGTAADMKNSIELTKPRHFRIRQVDGWFSDTNLLFKMKESRLIGLNSTTEGQGEAVFKSGVGVAKAVDIATGAAPSSSSLIKEFPKRKPARLPGVVCGEQGFIPNGKDITLKYSMSLSPDYSKFSDRLEAGTTYKPMEPDPGYVDLFNEILQSGKIPRPSLLVTLITPDPAITICSDPKTSKGDQASCATTHCPADKSEEGSRTLCLRNVAIAAIEVRTGDKTIWAQTVPVPFGAPSLAVPVPASKLFGKMVTTLALGDSGSIEQIGYAKTTGAAEILAAAAAIITFGATR